MIPYERAMPEETPPERQHIRCTDCGNNLKREEMVQGRFPSYVRPRGGPSRSAGFGRYTFYGEGTRDPLCRDCWKEAVRKAYPR